MISAIICIVGFSLFLGILFCVTKQHHSESYYKYVNNNKKRPPNRYDEWDRYL